MERMDSQVAKIKHHILCLTSSPTPLASSALGPEPISVFLFLLVIIWMKVSGQEVTAPNKFTFIHSGWSLLYT